jgi:hypothetical protein
MAGRKKLSELDKAKSKASRLYWKHQDTLTEEFAAEHVAKELQFFDSEKRMGRPPLKLSLIQSRALSDYSDALAEYREIEARDSAETIADQDIIDFKKTDRAGRKGKDEVLHIKKYIRRTLKQIKDIQDTNDSEFHSEHEGPGRPGMGKLEKVEYYRKRIFEAEEEIKSLLKTKAEHEVIYYDLFELKNDRRTLVVEQKKHEVGSTEHDRFAQDIRLLDVNIEPVQKQYDEALALAGVKQVRKAPSSRLGSKPAVEVGSWIDGQKSVDQKESESAEPSEFEKLKAEMREMKKMMQEQAELIKSLTAKQ